MTYTGIKEFVRLRSDMELIVTSPTRTMLGKMISELDIRRVHGVNIAFFGKKLPDGNYEYRIPNPDDILEQDDLLWLIGTNRNMKRIHENKP